MSGFLIIACGGDGLGMPKNNNALQQNMLVVVAAVVVIGLSVLVTLYFTGAILSSGSGENRGYQNVTFTDAVLTCKDKTRDEFGQDLSQLVIDDHSSRYEGRSFRYMIFLKADVKVKDEPTAMYFINCYVKSSTGRISKFETHEDREAPKGKVITKGGDKFIDWP